MARHRSTFEALVGWALLAVLALEVVMLAFLKPACFWSLALVFGGPVVALHVFARIPRRTTNPRLSWLSKSEAVVDGKWRVRIRYSPDDDARIEIAYRDEPAHAVRWLFDHRDNWACIYEKTVTPVPTGPGADAWTAALLAAVELVLQDIGFTVERGERPLTP